MKTEQGYIEIEAVNSNKMNINNPVGSGSFSMGRKPGSVIGDFSHTEGYETTASNFSSHAEGFGAAATGESSHAEGIQTTASGHYSHAEGIQTIAKSSNQHVQGKYNVADSKNKYAHIVGNGTSDSRSNAHTLDWNGVPWFQSRPQFGGTAQDQGS